MEEKTREMLENSGIEVDGLEHLTGKDLMSHKYCIGYDKKDNKIVVRTGADYIDHDAIFHESRYKKPLGGGFISVDERVLRISGGSTSLGDPDIELVRISKDRILSEYQRIIPDLTEVLIAESTFSKEKIEQDRYQRAFG